LPTIGNKDWYAWGSEILLAAQEADGSWRGRFGADIDTSFALLFLRRANLTSDLTAYLKRAGFVEVALKSGGVLGEGATRPGTEHLAKNEDNKEADAQKGSAIPSSSRSTDAGETKTAVGSPANPATAKEAKAPTTPVAKTASDPSTPAAKQADAEAARLRSELLQATGQQQDQLLNQFKQAKGAAYTQALAATIPRLQGESKTKARKALAERLANMTSATLRDKLRDETAETRRAATLACAMKADQQLIPDLITLLEDPQPTVARAAHAALKDLTDQDLGPADHASPSARAQAAEAWKNWWKKHSASKK
jgi:hypothetical protein